MNAARSLLRRWLLCALVAAAMAPVPASAQQEGAPPAAARPFRIAVDGRIGRLPFEWGQTQGLFAQQGVEIEVVRADGIQNRRIGLVKGTYDAIISTVDAFAFSAGQQLPAKAALKIGEAQEIVGLVAEESIQSVTDLKGRTVAFPRGSSAHFLLSLALGEAGLTFKDITSVHLTGEDAEIAFVTGAADAAVIPEPWLGNAHREGNGNVLVTDQAFPGHVAEVLLVADRTLAARPDDVVRVRRGFFEAVRQIQADPQAVSQRCAELMGVPVKRVSSAFENYRFAGSEENRAYFDDQVAEPSPYARAFSAAVRAWKADGLLVADVDPGSTIVPTMLGEKP